MTKACAITGSSGYVGGCVKRYFDARGWETYELTRRPQSSTRSIRFQLGDEVSPQLLSGFTALVHCAYDFKPLGWDHIRRVNVEGSRRMLQAARAAGIPKIVFISSVSAFEGCRSRYGRAKLEIEAIARECGALVIRPGLVYGPDAGGMFGTLVEQVRRSSLIPVIGGSQILFLVHHEDVCAFVERYANDEIAPWEGTPILTAAHERPLRFKELLLQIASGLHKAPTFIPLPWRFVWLGLKSAECCGLPLNVRSDSLISLMNPNPSPDFSPNAHAGLVCRPFSFPARA